MLVASRRSDATVWNSLNDMMTIQGGDSDDEDEDEEGAEGSDDNDS